MFFKHSLNGLKIILIVYVNDIILIEDNLTKIEILKIILAIEFEVRDLGQMGYFLGMEIARSKKGISISLRKYVFDILKEIGMLESKLSNTLIETGKRMESEKNQ